MTMRRTVFTKAAASALIVALATAAAAPADKFAAQAEKALTKRKLPAAIEAAEAAVVASPRDAAYRMLLGRAYLAAGRYRSASSSFADALALDGTRGAAALSLALTRVGLGEQDAARAVLERHGALITAGDRGLALALAGDPAEGVRVLEAEVRAGGDAKTRQNLALSYALAGRWSEAKLMASYDLDPVTLSQRIMEWSRFTREQQASAQVASLLGVAPGADSGQPQRLALAPLPNVQLAQAETASPVQPAPPPPVQMAEAVAAPAVETAPSAPAIQFAARNEVVQQLASPVVAAAFKPAAVRAPARPAQTGFAMPTNGRFVVQVGAYDSAAVAEDAWARMSSRIQPLRNVVPATATIVRGNATFHRLSVSGFATRTVAVSFCETLRARGGQCFVREAAGDAPLQWARRGGGTRLAAR